MQSKKGDEVTTYLIRNWSEFQHYKDRNPPWIKLHVGILSSQDWVTLDDKSRVLSIACMVLASKNSGKIDGSETGLAYLKRAAYLNSRPDLKPLILCGFLVPLANDSALQADASSSVYTEERRVEKSREEESREEKENVPAIAVTVSLPPDCQKLSERLRDGILRNNPTAKTPADLFKWGKVVDLMIRIDKRTPQQIAAVIDFSQFDSFWKQNVLSMDAVRRQFDRLVIKAMANSPKAKDDELMAEMKKWRRQPCPTL